jgi:hypothetical protein
MRFYTKNRKYYCGIDLHTKTMYVCLMDDSGVEDRHLWRIGG